MKTLGFYGGSDDLFECEIDGVATLEDSECGDKPMYMLVESGTDSLVVSALYSHRGTWPNWLVGIIPTAEDDGKHIPLWPMRFERSDRDYSAKLVIEAPDDATVTIVDKNGKPKDDEEDGDGE